MPMERKNHPLQASLERMAQRLAKQAELGSSRTTVLRALDVPLKELPWDTVNQGWVPICVKYVHQR